MPAPHAFYSKMLAERTASRNVFVLFYFILFIAFPMIEAYPSGTDKKTIHRKIMRSAGVVGMYVVVSLFFVTRSAYGSRVKLRLSYTSFQSAV